MLVGESTAYPHPFAITCSCHVGPGGGVNRAPIAGGKGRVNPNSMITGTGPAALAGVVRFNSISRLISGSSELSTCPIRCFVITGAPPTVSFDVLVTSHVTFGVFFGTRP